MTIFNVHIYREMKLRFDRIEADNPEAAAVIARDKPTDQADSIDDCDGETLAALVDVVGDEDFGQSVTIDFEAERLRQASPRLLAALGDLMEQLISVGIALECENGPELDFGQWAGTEGLSFVKARKAIAEAEAAGIIPAPGDLDIHELLAKRRQVAGIWSVEDVLSVRTDLTEDQCWDVLKATRRYHDATVGINWEVLECHAQILFGDAPETDEAEEA
jgi:hypothetical protein